MRTRRLSRRCAGSRPRWRGDTAERDTAGSAPLAEVALLRNPGLPALLVQAELGGAGESWETVLEAVRLLSHADASAAMLFGYHHLHLWRLGQYGNPGLAERAALGTAREGWFWGGASNPRDPADPGPGRRRLSGAPAQGLPDGAAGHLSTAAAVTSRRRRGRTP
ncbi:hypothetical protein ACQPZZ_22665 [Microbispora sp. CA-135349]|uniref:hypothetical protein n=1 Tax=Microbispora sp. CA-135349 TaxID=3239953 RepID=UPI003D8E34CD